MGHRSRLGSFPSKLDCRIGGTPLLAAGVEDGSSNVPLRPSEGPRIPSRRGRSGLFFFLCATAAWAGPLSGEAPVHRGRFEAFTDKAAQGPKMKVVAATYLGCPGNSEFVAGAGLSDDSVLVFGNAWGPEFLKDPTPEVLGKGDHHHLAATDAQKKDSKALRPENPDIAGFFALYSPGLKAIRRVVRFDWGVASLSTGLVLRDEKSVVLAGRSTSAFRTVLPHPEVAPPEEPGSEKAGPYDYEGVPCPGDVFLVRLSLASLKPEWGWVFPGARTPPAKIWEDATGALFTDIRGPLRISSDGRTMKRLPSPSGGGTARTLALDPRTGNFFFGGDRNTHTGHEPWRQPFLYGFDPGGTKLWKLWEWPARSLRDGTTKGLQGQVADSSARAGDVSPSGELVLGCWSDGGNTVLGSQPTDPAKDVPHDRFGMDNSGMKGANSISHLLRIDPRTQEAKMHAIWVAYLPQNFMEARSRGAPNFTSIESLRVLSGGEVLIAGRAATGLIQTPHAFFKYGDEGRRYGGSYASVWNSDWSNLLFSSYLPGLDQVRVGQTRRGALLLSRSRGDDGETPPTKSPVQNAIQKEKRGEVEGHLILLELP